MCLRCPTSATAIDDIPELVRGARAQARLLVGSPREVTDEDLASILRESLGAQRSSSHAIELMRQPSGVSTNWVEIAPRASNAAPFWTPRFS